MKGDDRSGLFGKEEGRDGCEVGGVGGNERDAVIFLITNLPFIS